MRIIKADCEIDYDGRGSTRRGRGIRLLILKDDGSFIIHSARGVKPVNYMTSGTSITESESADGIIVLSVESRKHEVIDVTIYKKLFDLIVPMVEDDSDVTVNGTERQFQEWLSRPRVWQSITSPGTVFIGRELKTANGAIDLVGYDASEDRLLIVEVKRRAKGNDVYQLLRYRDAIIMTASDLRTADAMLDTLRGMWRVSHGVSDGVVPNDADNGVDMMSARSLLDPKCMLIGESAHDGTEDSCAQHGVSVRIMGSEWWGSTVDNSIASRTALDGKSRHHDQSDSNGKTNGNGGFIAHLLDK